MKNDNDQYYGVSGVIDLFPRKKSKGVATISNFKFDEQRNSFYNVRATLNGGYMFKVRTGKYVRLHVNGELMMSDTGMERHTNKEFIDRAHGRVLIAGLGIGMVVKNILQKKRVKEVIIIEKYQDVIDLVSPAFKDKRLKIICADIFEWKPGKGEKFDVMYFDIWPDICSDNLSEIKLLHSRFKHFKNKDNPHAWMDSWLKSYLQKLKRKEY